MSLSDSFSQILERNLKKDSNSMPHSQEIFGQEPAHLAFLLGEFSRVEVITPPSPQWVGKFKSLQRRPTQDQARVKTTNEKVPQAAPARPRGKPHSLSLEQKQSLEEFQKCLRQWKEEELREDFTSRELQKAFRRLALRTHPDRRPGSGEAFIEIKRQHQILLTVLTGK